MFKHQTPALDKQHCPNLYPCIPADLNSRAYSSMATGSTVSSASSPSRVLTGSAGPGVVLNGTYPTNPSLFRTQKSPDSASRVMMHVPIQTKKSPTDRQWNTTNSVRSYGQEQSGELGHHNFNTEQSGVLARNSAHVTNRIDRSSLNPSLNNSGTKVSGRELRTCDSECRRKKNSVAVNTNSRASFFEHPTPGPQAALRVAQVPVPQTPQRTCLIYNPTDVPNKHKGSAHKIPSEDVPTQQHLGSGVKDITENRLRASRISSTLLAMDEKLYDLFARLPVGLFTIEVRVLIEF